MERGRDMKGEKDVEAERIAREKKKSRDAEAKRDAKIEKDRKALEAQKKEKAFADYEARLKDVTELKDMTDTPAWQKLYAEMQVSIDRHAVDVLDAEKPRDVVKHQEGVKILRGLIFQVRGPVDALNSFVNNTPLFAPSEVARANFNEALGTVELTR